jgi:predicted dehydrogenase
MKKNIAVIGCGYWGKNLVRNFYELGVLSSICDPNYLISNKFSKKYNVKNNSFIEILDDPNIAGIVFAVPAELHASMAVDAMNKGKHVFVEKPLAMNEVEGKFMIKTARKNNVQLMVGHLLQYHPIFRTIRKIIKAGDIGELKYIYSNRLSFGKVRSKEDVIWSFAPHDISMILSIIGKEPKNISVSSNCILQKKIADTASIHLEFEMGLKSNISVSWLNPYKEQKLVVVGKSAMLVFDDTKSWSEKLAYRSYKIEHYHDLPNLQKHNEKYIKVTEEEPLKSECQHFVDVVNGNSKPLTDGAEGLRVLKVLSAASLANEKNEIIKL